jgi:iron(III) transport system ATP-binding protein
MKQTIDTAADAYLRIEQVSKQFGLFTALDDISLEVAESEFVCFLGPSGCGKTTLLRAIAGLGIQTSGRIFQEGRDISALPPNERDFGIVFQSYALFPNLTVTRNVAYGLENRRTTRADIKRRVGELLELVGLSDQEDKYPAQLSGGQQQRVALARALAPAPGLLLLDEPLSALDAKVRVYLRQEIKDLQRRVGVTTVMVTHDQEEAMAVADRIVVMNQGVIEQIGTPFEVYSEPATAFVADFIGTMNFISGELIARDRVRLGQYEIVCPEQSHAAGQLISVAIRPEDIVVHNRAGQLPNTFHFGIDHLEFLGAFARVQMSSAVLGEHKLQADLSANVMRRLQLSAGSTLTIQLPCDHLRIYPRPPDG